jgi:hypothetical protein
MDQLDPEVGSKFKLTLVLLQLNAYAHWSGSWVTHPTAIMFPVVLARLVQL